MDDPHESCIRFATRQTADVTSLTPYGTDEEWIGLKSPHFEAGNCRQWFHVWVRRELANQTRLFQNVRIVLEKASRRL